MIEATYLGTAATASFAPPGASALTTPVAASLAPTSAFLPTDVSCFQAPGGRSVRQPSASEKAAGCQLAVVPCRPPTSCAPGYALLPTPCGPQCFPTQCGPYQFLTEGTSLTFPGAYPQCNPDPNLESRVTATDPAVNTCRPPLAYGGRTNDGKLICVQCKGGLVPNATQRLCTPPRAALPPFGAVRLQTRDLPASFYAHLWTYAGVWAPITDWDPPELRASGKKMVYRSLTATKLQDMHLGDQFEYQRKKDDWKWGWDGEPVKLRVKYGELPFITWTDPISGAPVGAFYNSQLGDRNWLKIKLWDPKTIWDAIKSAFCQAAPYVVVGASVYAQTTGGKADPASANAIITALCSGSLPPAETADVALPPDPLINVKVVDALPAGSIFAFEPGVGFRIAVPVGSAPVLGATKTGEVTHQELELTQTDPTPRGAERVALDDYKRRTGKVWYKSTAAYVAYAVIGAAVVAGGGYVVIRRRRQRQLRA